MIEGKAKVEVVKLETTRQFVHNWQMEDLLPQVNDIDKGRSIREGKNRLPGGPVLQVPPL